MYIAGKCPKPSPTIFEFSGSTPEFHCLSFSSSKISSYGRCSANSDLSVGTLALELFKR